MAVQKNIQFINRNKVIVHLISTSSGDTSTVLLTDLLASDETTSLTTALAVNIASAYVNCNDNTANGIATRRGGSSGTVVLDMHGSSEYPGSNALPALAFNNTSSIFVNFGIGGTCILELHKVAGYVMPTTNVGV
jgi:hypothetical protein